MALCKVCTPRAFWNTIADDQLMTDTTVTHKADLALEHAVEGKIIFLLALIGLVQFGYPVTAYGTGALAPTNSCMLR